MKLKRLKRHIILQSTTSTTTTSFNCMTIYVHKVLQRPHLSTHTPNFTIICQNRSKRAVSVLLGFVCRLKLWRELRAFSFLRDPESFRSRQGNISFVKNTISEPLGFKIYWGRMLSDPRSPLLPSQQTRVSGTSFQAQPPSGWNCAPPSLLLHLRGFCNWWILYIL